MSQDFHHLCESGPQLVILHRSLLSIAVAATLHSNKQVYDVLERKMSQTLILCTETSPIVPQSPEKLAAQPPIGLIGAKAVPPAPTSASAKTERSQFNLPLRPSPQASARSRILNISRSSGETDTKARWYAGTPTAMLNTLKV
jgi:hypothetical protein